LAEKKAIEYCKQRCVGVPPTQESSTCIVQLGTKIARMKVKYRFILTLPVCKCLETQGKFLSLGGNFLTFFWLS
jgi:hypothetical protein